MRSLDDSWKLGDIQVENRLVLAPLAGIGSWFVRLQARRFGAGLVFSEMVSSLGVVHGNERTVREFLRIHPDEHPVAIQLFGSDVSAMGEAASRVAEAGADVVDINMGCPVRKVCRSGAGVALLDDPDRAVALASAAREGSGLPTTVKLRPGRWPGERSGIDLARRLAEEAGVSAVAFHPRHAAKQHKGSPDWDMAAELMDALDVPVILSGGLNTDDRVREAFRSTGAEAAMLARGSLGNPWRFERLLGRRIGDPSIDEVAAELDWVIARCEDHLGVDRAGRRLRKFYPWYASRMELPSHLREPLVTAPTTVRARAAIAAIRARIEPEMAA